MPSASCTKFGNQFIGGEIMNEITISPRNLAVNNLKATLLSVSSESNKQHEFILPVDMLEKFFHCYRFAHDSIGQPYMRARIEDITLEYLILNGNCKEARICQISKSGRLIYSKPDNPVGTIYLK